MNEIPDPEWKLNVFRRLTPIAFHWFPISPVQVELIAGNSLRYPP